MSLKKVKYQILKSKDQIIDLVTLLSRQDRFCFDLETTSLKTHSVDIRIVGIGFCFKASESFYIPFNDPSLGLERSEILELLRPILEDPSIPKIGQNIKYDIRVLNRFGINVVNILMDTMVASYCLFSDRYGHALDEMCLIHLGHIKIRTKSVIPGKKGKVAQTMEDNTIENVGVYCNEDCDWCYRLYEYYSYLFTLPEYTYAKKLFDEFENPLTPILIDMECNGVVIDTKILDGLREEIITKITDLKAQINLVAGKEIIITNPTQIGELIYDQLKLFDKHKLKPKKTKTGKLATTEKILSLIKQEPVVEAILQVKKLNKLLSTYIDPIPKEISGFTNRLHASFGQTRTSTSRLNSSDPNLQQIPKREEIGQRIRSAFISRFKGGKILSCDYSQQELRLLAHICQEPVLIETYKRNGDAHKAAASMVYKIPELEVTDKQRYLCKTIQYAILYGAEANKISEEAKIPLQEAEELIALYMSRMTHVDGFLRDTKKFLLSNGYTETIFGWRRYIPKVYSPIRYIRAAAIREAGNSVIQGSAAGQCKLAAIGIKPYLKEYQSKIIMLVHDEIVLDTHPDEFFIKDEVKKIMEEAVILSVPMIADGKLADNWMEAH